MTIDQPRWRRILCVCPLLMPENALLLNRFLDACGNALNEGDIANLYELLHLTDSALWDLIAGRSDVADPTLAAFVARLRVL